MRKLLGRFCLIVVVIVLIALTILLLFRHFYRDDIRILAETHVKNATSDLINDAIDQQIDHGNMQYDRLVYFEKDVNGRITALKTNMSEVNRLKTDILNIINDEILQIDTEDLGIASGNLILPEIFAGKGPRIPVQIISIRNSDASFSSTFSQAGINQTLHKLNMHVCVDVTVLVLGKSESYTVSSQVVVAETVIVGQVPDTFLQTGGIYGDKETN